ncbi:hypothetical protein K5V07_09330 [Flavobacterium sp. CHNK8]|uniref:hypothetical protein n=1 Tax=Flavobacterium sp. CHNK8 TaxID=2871165 RepID=UPI001C8E548B|nr:hypothetical protein [Flavobacterium sp. CHNK8]QZK90681.1 hypothetical protein K5V07_09330 [Flavobacterium sp. CHNK8]
MALSIERQIEIIRNRAEQEIKVLEMASQAVEARKELQKIFDKEQKELISTQNLKKIEFLAKYGQTFEFESKTPSTPLQTKLNFVTGMVNVDGSAKYKLNEGGTAILGAKDEPLKSTIVFRFNGKKETLSAKTLLQYLKKNSTLTR